MEFCISSFSLSYSIFFLLWSVITSKSWDVFYKTITSLFFCCWFCQQLRSILPSKFFSFNSFNSSGGFVLFLIKYHSILSSSCSIPPCLGGVLPNSFSLIRFLSRSNRSGFLVYLIPWAFDSRHSLRSSFLLECSWFFASSLEFLFHLIPFLFRLGPKISGWDLLLVEECCNAPNSMRQVSASYSPSLPCHLLVCCIFPCHHLHFIIMF